MSVYTIPKSATFGQESEWQYNIGFIKQVKLKIAELNDNEYQIYEEQIEDVIRALAEMDRVIIAD